MDVSADVLARRVCPMVPDVDWSGAGSVCGFEAREGSYVTKGGTVPQKYVVDPRSSHIRSESDICFR